MNSLFVRKVGWLLILSGSLLAGCAGVQSFPSHARAGDTVSLALGWHPDLSRQDVTVTITDSAGGQTVYPPGDAMVWALYNVNPDPVSKMIVGSVTGQDLGNGEQWLPLLLSSDTGGDTEWMQSMMLMELPASLATGRATIAVTGPSGPLTPSPIRLVIDPGQGSSTQFTSQNHGGVNPATLERADHFTVSFTGGVVPHAIQVVMPHTPGVGVPWVTFPRGDIMSGAWSDTGSLITVFLYPTRGVTAGSLFSFKFYVAGGVTGLTLPAANVKAFDVNGNLIPDISATIQ